MDSTGQKQPGLFDHFESKEEREKREIEEAKAAKLAEKREKLERLVATRQLDTLESRVAYVLAQFPETRNSDITLLIQYWKAFEREKVPSDVISLQTLYEVERLTSVARARATIQNDYKLYLATSDKVARKRKQLSEENRERRKPVNMDAPPMTIYADESGKNEKYLIVGSVWIMVPMEEARMYVAMTEWREKRKFKQELKFSKISKKNQDHYIDFIERFMVQEGVFGFKAIAMPSEGISDEGTAFSDLFYFLIRRGIEHEDATGRAPLPRRITFIKDYEEQGYDDRVIALLVDRMQNASQSLFNGQLTIEYAYAERSEASLFIQVADLFTGCIHRVLNKPAPERGWKDDFAEEVLALLGMSSGLDQADVLNDRAVQLSLQSHTLKGQVNDT